MEILDQSKLSVKKSWIKEAGLGLFTDVPLLPEQIISVFQGKRTKGLLSHKDSLYAVQLSDGTGINTRPVEGKAKWANDAQFNTIFENNSEIVEIEIEGRLEAAIIATKDIKAGAEIFLDYGSTYWQ